MCLCVCTRIDNLGHRVWANEHVTVGMCTFLANPPQNVHVPLGPDRQAEQEAGSEAVCNRKFGYTQSATEKQERHHQKQPSEEKEANRMGPERALSEEC